MDRYRLSNFRMVRNPGSGDLLLLVSGPTLYKAVLSRAFSLLTFSHTSLSTTSTKQVFRSTKSAGRCGPRGRGEFWAWWRRRPCETWPKQRRGCERPNCHSPADADPGPRPAYSGSDACPPG